LLTPTPQKAARLPFIDAKNRSILLSKDFPSQNDY